MMRMMIKMTRDQLIEELQTQLSELQIFLQSLSRCFDIEDYGIDDMSKQDIIAWSLRLKAAELDLEKFLENYIPESVWEWNA